jgi:type IV pilus assembly protein PilY1
MYFPTGSSAGGTFVLPASSAPNSLLLMDGNGADTKGVNKMLTRISQLSLKDDKSNNNQISQAMQESWAFYQGKQGLSGVTYPGLTAQLCAKNFVVYITLATNNQKPQDGGNLGGLALKQAQALSLLPTQLTLPNWQSPISPNGKANEKYKSDYSDEWANFMYTGTSPNLTTPYPSITSYTIILSDGSNPDYEQLLVSTANQGGGKYFVVELGNLDALAEALRRVFVEVQATNSVFAAPVLPVSANTQGTYLNQIYLGMFRPEANNNPRWMGNLKQYQFGVNTSDPTSPQLFLADASWGPYLSGTTANSALSSGGTGFITPGAISFWTAKNTTTVPDEPGGFWLNAIKQQGGTDGYDLADGQIVEKGGVGQQIRLKYLTDTYPNTIATSTSSTTSRSLYTCIGTCTPGTPATLTTPYIPGTSLNTMPFSTVNPSLMAAVASRITSSTPPVTATNLINWVRGEDTFAQIGDKAAGPESSAPPDSTITIRGSAHGDVLHSRPAVINYGGSIGVVVFYGTNDGVFRAINGNQPNNTTDSTKPLGYCTTPSTSTGTVPGDCSITMTDAKGKSASIPPGGELWGFVPQEFYGGLQRMYQNSPALKIGTSSFGTPKNYFFDGSTSVYQNKATGKAYIFLSARRGGRLLYALDVSDPATPKFMWKRTNADTGFGELGQTWSQPKVAFIKGYNDAAGVAKPVLIFGAGYDTNEDIEPPKADTMGRGIFIVDAETGAMLWQAVPSCQASGSVICVSVSGMTSAMAADITLVDRNIDGFIDRLYAADVGGNIWRVDLEPEGIKFPNNLLVTRLAALGGTGTTKRKMFFPPDVVMTKTYDVVLATTGDREHPLLTQQANSIVNRFYMVKDTNVGMSATGWATVLDDSSSTAIAPPNAPSKLFNATSTPYDQSLSGFYITLQGLDASSNPSNGEKGVNAPTTVGGTVYFGTNQPITPSANSCQANLGKARGYAVNFLTGQSNFTIFDGGGLPPSPVFGIVTVNVNNKPQQLPFLIGGGGGLGADSRSGLGTKKPVVPINMKKKRTYWYRDIDR